MRSFVFALLFYPFTLLWAAALLVTLAAPTRGPMMRGVRMWTGGALFLVRLIGGIRVEVRGQENLPEQGACILVSKHMSNLDVVVTYRLRPDMTALAKKELFRVPFIGAIFRKLGIVRIDRQSGRAHEEMPRVIAEIVEKERPLVVYPEGTRTRPGERRKLKSGAFFLQLDGKLPAIPIATSSGLHWPKGLGPMRPGTVVYEIGEPLPNVTNKAAFMRLVDERVIERSDALMREDPVWTEAAEAAKRQGK